MQKCFKKLNCILTHPLIICQKIGGVQEYYIKMIQLSFFSKKENYLTYVKPNYLVFMKMFNLFHILDFR